MGTCQPFSAMIPPRSRKFFLFRPSVDAESPATSAACNSVKVASRALRQGLHGLAPPNDVTVSNYRGRVTTKAA